MKKLYYKPHKGSLKDRLFRVEIEENVSWPYNNSDQWDTFYLNCYENKQLRITEYSSGKPKSKKREEIVAKGTINGFLFEKIAKYFIGSKNRPDRHMNAKYLTLDKVTKDFPLSKQDLTIQRSF